MSDENVGRWALIELMGHRQRAGRITEAELAGARFLRIDVPGEGDQVIASQLYSPSAIYCITPVEEEVARKAAAHYRPPQPLALARPLGDVADYSDDDDDFDDPDDDEPF